MIARRDIPIQYLRECFDMNERGELFWKHRPPEHFQNYRASCWWAHQVGRKAGRLTDQGYYVVTIAYQGKPTKVLCHRIVWALTHGDWPQQFIDHINRVRSDNTPSNLRDVSHTENVRNSDRGKGVKRRARAAIAKATGEQP